MAGDVGPDGRAYAARLFQWSHAVFEDLMVSVGDRLDRAFDEEGWGMPLVHAEATVLGALRPGTLLRVGLSVERVGRKSLTLAFEFRSQAGMLLARTRLIHAFAPLDGLAGSLVIPPRLRGVLRRGGLTEFEQSVHSSGDKQKAAHGDECQGELPHPDDR